MNTQNLDMALPVSVGSLNAYIYRVNQIPILSAETELELATRFRSAGDLVAARQLVLAHLRFVVKIAQGYLGYGLALADLIQEGTVGLMKAVKKFDPTRKVRLVSFAVHWIKAEIHEFILRNWRMVKIATTKAQRKLFFNLRRATKHLHWLNNSETEAVARDFKVSPKDVRDMELRFSGGDVAYDYTADEDDVSQAPVTYLEDQRFNPADALEKQNANEYSEATLSQALGKLDQRSRDILKQRWLQDGKKSTLHDLAAQYNISAERVRQLEEAAFNKLRQEIDN